MWEAICCEWRVLGIGTVMSGIKVDGPAGTQDFALVVNDGWGLLRQISRYFQ